MLKQLGGIGGVALLTLLAGCAVEDAAPVDDPAIAGDTASVRDTITEDPVIPAATAQSDTVITPDGWGPLRIGMTLDEVVAAAGPDANPTAVGGPEPEACDEFRPSRAPDGVLVMIERGVLTRISVSDGPPITTPAGIRIGDTGADVLRAYGSRTEVLPHKYIGAPARYITVWSTNGGERRGLRYETDMNDDVVFIRGGGDSIEYVEGCL